MTGLCRICTKPIKIGDQITRGATGRWVHQRCFDARAGGSRLFTERAIERAAVANGISREAVRLVLEL